MLKTPEPVDISAILSDKGPITAEDFAQLSRAVASVRGSAGRAVGSA